MTRILLLICIFTISLFSKDTLYIKQKNALYVQGLIDFEEKIAFAYEEYILREFEIPSINNLLTADYLGTNRSAKNIKGNDISFISGKSLQLNYAVIKESEPYVNLLYERDLYRFRTTVYKDSLDSHSNNYSNSYVEINLQSEEAINIQSLLLSGAKINKNCTTLEKNTYCNLNDKTIRWYNNDLNWIEYDKELLNQGNVAIKNVGVLSDSKINDLSVGSYIYIENGPRYIKLMDNKTVKVN